MNNADPVSVARRLITAGLGVAFLLGLTSAAAADVSVKIVDGRVTVIANDATAAEILDEWARVGGATIVNRDALAPDPITLELLDISEQSALDVLLRSTGYLATLRENLLPRSSRFGRIILIPKRTHVELPEVAAASAFDPSETPQPTFVPSEREEGSDGELLSESPQFEPSPSDSPTANASSVIGDSSPLASASPGAGPTKPKAVHEPRPQR